ncbi:MAG: ethanolamine ammonia-lyase subunit EutB, partial [Pirellula sp.]
MAHSQLGLTRRRVLQTGLFTATVASLTSIGLAQSQSSNQPKFEELTEPIPHEDLVSYVHRIAGQWDLDLYRKVLGSANEYKEGDEIIGVAARSPVERKIARRLLGQTTLSQIESHPPFNDRMLELIKPSEKQPIVDSETTESIDDWTFGKLKKFLLESGDARIHPLLPSLSSDVIACVVKLMSNQELIEVGRKVFNPLPGSKLGAQGYMGARIQPNSPTDHPEDIRWQVFNAFAYAVGDVLVGTNPVSSEPESVASVEATLKDVLDSFGISSSIPHCVLAHI